MKTLLVILLFASTIAGAQDCRDNPCVFRKADVARDTYRGRLSDNQFGRESTGNQFGRYGSQFSADSINNQFGAGSPFKQDSPTNPFGRGVPIYQQGE